MRWRAAMGKVMLLWRFFFFLQRHDVEGDCCDYRTSRSIVQRVEDWKEGGRGENGGRE